MATPHGHGQTQQPALPGVLEGESGSSFTVEQAGRIRAAVKKILNWKKDGFPGGQPVSLNTHNMAELFRNPYVACEKTDGIRFLMLGANKRIYLIGRRDEVREVAFMYLPRAVDLSEPQEMTLLDGELVMDSTDSGGFVWRYLIYDCIAVDGNEEIQHLNLLKRLQAAKKYVTEPLSRLREEVHDPAAHMGAPGTDSMDLGCDLDGIPGGVSAFGGSSGPKKPLDIYLKDFFEIFDIETIQKLALRLPHPSDGIIFTPVKLPYITGTCPMLLKWKPPHLNTCLAVRQVDFCVEPVYDLEGVLQMFILCASFRGVRTFAGLILAPYGNFYKELYEMACRGQAGGAIVECFWVASAPVYTFYPALRENPTPREERLWSNKNKGHPFYDFNRGEWREGGWVAERIRTDKPMPNDMKVVASVKRSIDEGVTFAMLQREVERFKLHKKPSVADFCKAAEMEAEEDGLARETT